MADDQRPARSTLLALGVDDWAGVLATALPVVRSLPDRLVDATVRRLAALPPGRLMAGRSREDLVGVLLRPEVWELVLDAFPDGAGRPWDAEDRGGTAPDDGAVARLTQQVAHLRDREQRLSATVAELRADVDRLRRERDGAVVRAARAEEVAAADRAALDAARAEADAAAARADDADRRVADEVARQQRRDDAAVAQLRDDLRTARRTVEGLRRELADERAQAERLRTAAAAAAGPGTAPSAVDDDHEGGRRGRPSILPDGIERGTRRAAEWLVAGCVLLVDGYNVTRTHRADLSFEEQRRWLEDAVGALARRRHVDATIIWDSALGRATRRRRSGVTVRFTAPDATADDELVLHVELALAPDDPVVVVTDDAELRQRLARHRVDLLDSTSFTWLL